MVGKGEKVIRILFSVFLSFGTGLFVGHFFMRKKQNREISLLRDSLSYWRRHLGMSYRTFDPDIYDE
jgi:hypothetical protein